MKTVTTFMTGLAIGLGVCALIMMNDSKEPGPKMIAIYAVIILVAAQALDLAMRETPGLPVTTQ